MANHQDSGIMRLLRRWFLDALSAMALGLFSSLLIGTIFLQIGKWTTFSLFTELGTVAMNSLVYGAAIGVAIGYSLKAKALVIFTAAATGAIGCKAGGPVGAYLGALVGAELSNLVAGKTKLDILLVPGIGLLAGGAAGFYVGPYIGKAMTWIGTSLGHATTLQPILMGLIMAVFMGLALTAPISSAAIAAMIFTADNINSPGVALAAGAATVGCCCQMLGFAISSWRENGFGGFLAQGIGTSMLQISNILQHPLILIPPTLTAAILGPISTTLMPIYNVSGTAGGMGTCGLVGPAGAWVAMMPDGFAWWPFVKILLLCIVLPLLLSFGISEGMRKAGWIKPGNMKLEL